MESKQLFEKIEKLKMPHRILILAGTLVLLGGLFLWLVAIPKLHEIDRTKKDIQKLAEQLNQAKIRARNIQKFEAELAEVKTEFQEALTLLPNEAEIPNLLRSITQLGTDSQLEFRLFSPKRERAKDFYQEIPVAIEVSGNYHNVALFFDKVAKMDRIVNILDVSMKPVKERSTTLITTCDAVTYSFKGGSDAKKTQAKK